MSKFLKSIFFILSIIFSIFNIFINKSYADNQKNIPFIVTAYYSPLPWQKHYITWSYYWDKRLNWKWHTTASWKTPFSWVLAAPSKYPFWTKIYFEWYWIGVVEDRGWAIVKAWVRWHAYDRIDIWMWYWDEWLQRALNWWKRTIKARVVSTKNKTNLKFAQNIIFWLANIKVNPEIHKKNDVIKLQKALTKFWLYKWNIDWNYNSIKNTLINYQLKHRLISSRYQEAAWWFWPKTYKSILRHYSSKDVIIRQNINNIIETNPKIEIVLESPEINLNWDHPQISEVKKVQSLFKKLWLYNWNIDWNYNNIKNKIIEIQKEAHIIKNNNSWWAWYFWEKTKAALIKYCENKYSQHTIVSNRRKINNITIKQKEKLNKIVSTIKNYINKKAWIDRNKKKLIKNKIEKKLLVIKQRVKKIDIKLQINYIIENI